MNFYNNLYLGKRARRHRLYILLNLKLKRQYKNLHILAILNQKHSKINIIKNTVFLKNISYYKDYMIIGLAYDKEEALELLSEIALDVYKKDIQLNFLEFFFDKPALEAQW